ncbi:Gp15 family bacteriophage protein [Acutalibacter sp. 1XD8-36]|uniref:Gp15 family bacteriophage protein n=1 Tax=Acutalibacter sp. 1XD8-36 TaxID=2320852 RepID=UPI001372A59F|nr:Gp15 family bacteriophage protein [Acutalibacter sp. 1XD8-36]
MASAIEPYELPESLTIAGREYEIRTDFRDVLNILTAFRDPDMEEREKIYVCLFVLFVDFEELPSEDYDAAFEAASTFIDCGREWKDSPRKSPRVMDWEQDGSLLFPAINKVAGREVRTVDYMHWWTFMGCYMEISDGIFSTILSIRQKRAKGKKLEKWEREFWEANKDICVLKKKISREEQEERDRLKALLS